MTGMTSNRPYLIRAIYDWLVDNDQTPHLLVDATSDGVVVPQRFVRDGNIVLNIGPGAVQNLELRNDAIAFVARFGGAPMEVLVPPIAVLGIYSKETGIGMMFPLESKDTQDVAENEPAPQTPLVKKGKPKLTLIK